MKEISRGVYPVMITPFTDQNAIDWNAVDEIVEFYVRQGCQGVFAVCQSSEMFYLSEDERVELARRVVKAAAGRLCVVASGHVSDGYEDQVRELRRVADTGVDAVVMLSNRLAAQDEDDDVLIRNMHRLLEALPDVNFGVYECPHPYKRLLTERVLQEMADCGRFSFIKDTCCDADRIARRVQVLGGRVKLFNANAATLRETLLAGADGFSGIMANYHPELYVWLMENLHSRPEDARRLAAFLSMMSAAEGCCHPVCAKYHMNLVDVPMSLHTRIRSSEEFGPLDRHAIDDLLVMEQSIRGALGL